MNDSTQDPKPATPAEVACDVVGRDLLVACLGELRQHKTAYAELKESEQERSIARLTEVIRAALGRAVAIMATGGFQHATATLEKVEANPKGVKGTLANIGREHRHAVFDHAGLPVLIVLTATETYMARVGEVGPIPDQAALDLGPAPGEGDGSGFNGERHATDDDAPGRSATDGGADVGTAGDDAARGTPEAATPADPNPGDFTVEVVLDALAALDLGEEFEVLTWTQERRAAVVDFCYALHLKEQGHTEIALPPRPPELGDVAL